MPLLAITTTFTAAATVFLLLRLYTRFLFVKSPGVDDCLMVAAMMADYVFYAFAVVEMYHGLGIPQRALPKTEFKTQLKALWLTVPFYNLSLTLTKLSMLVLYMRIFRTSGFLLATRLITAVIILSGLWMVISSFSFCVPISAFWDTGLSAQCLPEVIWFLNASIQIATDVVIVLFPMPLLGRLKLPMREKVGVIVVFGGGVFVCVVSAIRLWVLSEMVSSRDTTKTNGPVTLWSSIETNVAIICASLPALHPLLTRLFPRLLASSILHRSRSKSKSGSQSESEAPSGTPSGTSLDGGGRRLDGRTMGVSDRAGGESPGPDHGAGREEIKAGMERTMDERRAGAGGMDEAIEQAEEEEDWGEKLRKKRWRREMEAQM